MRKREEARLEEQKRINDEQSRKEIAKQTVSVVDEIRGLKQLLDEGILTEEEFVFKKRQLLGMP